MVGLFWAKARANHCDLHGLFLKQGDAKCFPQNFLQGAGWIFDGFFTLTAIDIGVHHAPLNGTGAHDRNLDHQIIKGLRLHAGQEIHLRPAFHLKYANRICAAQHVIGVRILLWDGSNAKSFALMLGDQVKGFADTGQHAQ